MKKGREGRDLALARLTSRRRCRRRTGRPVPWQATHNRSDLLPFRAIATRSHACPGWPRPSTDCPGHMGPLVPFSSCQPFRTSSPMTTPTKTQSTVPETRPMRYILLPSH